MSLIDEIRNLPVVPVVIDPVLARHLRPHQKEGLAYALVNQAMHIDRVRRCPILI